MNLHNLVLLYRGYVSSSPLSLPASSSPFLSFTSSPPPLPFLFKPPLLPLTSLFALLPLCLLFYLSILPPSLFQLPLLSFFASILLCLSDLSSPQRLLHPSLPNPEAREPVTHQATQVWESGQLTDSKVEQFLVVARLGSLVLI